MSKRILAVTAVLLFAGALNFLAAANTKTETWKGYVTDTWCGLHRETEAPTVACTNLCLQNKGAKYALFDVVHNKLYILNPQTEAAKYAAKMVTVTGTIGDSAKLVTAQGTIPGSTIIASSISLVPSKSN
jgi:ATP/ADP translocase